MTLDQALLVIERYSIDAGVDSLSGIEQMVRYVRTLTPEQLEALDVFMIKTKEPA
jgi:hypothetical protein